MSIKTHHTVTLDEVEIGEEPVVLTQGGGDWSIDGVCGESIATGEEWFDESGKRCVALTLLTPGVCATLVRNFLDSVPAGPDTPTY